jgi:hypothetical protein
MLPYSRIFAPQIDQFWLEFEPGRDRRFRRPEATESHLARNSRSANLTVRNSECVQWGYKNDDVVPYANRHPDGLSELFGASIYGRPSRTWAHVRAFSCTKSSPGTCASKRNRGADARHPAFLHGFHGAAFKQRFSCNYCYFCECGLRGESKLRIPRLPPARKQGHTYPQRRGRRLGFQ